MRGIHKIRGLYAITPDIADTQELLTRVTRALAGGAALIQYRNKAATPNVRLSQGMLLAQLCRQWRRPLIVNDQLDLAIEIDADGVHLGKDDCSVTEARLRLGPQKIIGASAYDRIDLAQSLVRMDIDYVAFGSFFPSVVKPDALRPPIDLLRAAKREFRLPIVAIGGITLESAGALIDAGADAIAAISAVFEARDIVAAAAGFRALFEKGDASRTPAEN